MKLSKTYVVAGEKFRTKDEVLARARLILESVQLGSKIDERNIPFLSDLLTIRADKLGEIGERRIVYFSRGMQPPPYKTTECFWMHFLDGTKLDSSFPKAVKALKPNPR